MFKAFGLYSHIRANRIRSIFLLASFVVLLQAVLFSVALLLEAFNGGTFEQIAGAGWRDMRSAWPIAIAAALLWFLFAFAFHQRIIDAATGAGGVIRADAPKLYDALENLCISRGIPIPALKIIETTQAGTNRILDRDGKLARLQLGEIRNNAHRTRTEEPSFHERKHQLTKRR